jgi:hypothetical protein
MPSGSSCERQELGRDVFGRKNRMMPKTLITCLGLFALACGTHDDTTPRRDDAGVNADIADDGYVGTDVGDAGGDSVDPLFCTRSGECFLRPEDCCGKDCSLDALITRNNAGFQGYLLRCAQRGCTPCHVSARWVPQCVEHRCTIVDLETSSISACRTDSDCKLRWEATCCEQCNADPDFDLVSVSQSSVFCAAGDNCDPCKLSPFPPQARAVCVNEHCQVQK